MIWRRRLGIALGLLGILVISTLGATPVHAQPDSVRAAILEERGFSPDHSPRRALWRAAAVPGWGQLYNRQFYKMPFVYAGLGGGGYAIYEMNRRYVLYRHANLYKIGENQAEGDNGANPYQRFEDEYNRVVQQLGGERIGDVSGRQLRQLRDKYRRWRDLSIVGTGLFYALTILDAYVSAHLLTFNVGDVALDVRPTGGEPVLAEQSTYTKTKGPSMQPKGLGVRLHLRF
jgi:hypothetical protein